MKVQNSLHNKLIDFFLQNREPISLETIDKLEKLIKETELEFERSSRKKIEKLIEKYGSDVC